MSTVKAKWIGAFEARTPDGTLLVPNETVLEISAGEAKDSDHWEPVTAKAQTHTPAKDAD